MADRWIAVLVGAAVAGALVALMPVLMGDGELTEGVFEAGATAAVGGGAGLGDEGEVLFEEAEEPRGSRRERGVAPRTDEAWLAGTISAPDGAGLEGATVRLQALDGERPGDVLTARSRRDGSYRVVAEAGVAYRVEVLERRHYLPEQMGHRVVEGENRLDLTLNAYSVVAGVARDMEGEPVSGAVVGMSGGGTVRTDALGRFRLAQIRQEKGIRFLAALTSDFELAGGEQLGLIAPGSVVEDLELLMAPSGRVEGRVTDHRGEPFAGATVSLSLSSKQLGWWQPVLLEIVAAAGVTLNGRDNPAGAAALGWNGADWITATSRADGSYRLPLLWEGKSAIFAEAENHFELGGRRSLEVPRADVVLEQDFVLRKGGVLAGRFVWPDGIPEGARVRIEAVQRAKKRGFSRTNEIEAGETWWIEGLREGVYDLRFTVFEPMEFDGSRFGGPIAWDRAAQLGEGVSNGWIDLGAFEGLSANGGRLNIRLEGASLISEGGAYISSNPGSPSVQRVVAASSSDRIRAGAATLQMEAASSRRIEFLQFAQDEEVVEIGAFSNDAVGAMSGLRILSDPAGREIVAYGEMSELEVGYDEGREDLVVTMGPPVVAEGFVLDTAGGPVEGATVSLELVGTRFADRVRRARTDEQGRYRITSYGEGRYRLAAQADGYFPSKRRESSLFAGGSLYETITLDRGLRIAGTVYGLDGRPASGVSVFLNDKNSTKTTTTDDGGRFSFDRVVRGDHRIYARSGGKSGQDQSARMALDLSFDRDDLFLELRPSLVIEGRVVDSKGQPVANRTVRATGRDNGSLKREGKTDAEGRFSIVGCYPGPYRVVADEESAKNKRRVRGKSRVTSKDVDLDYGRRTPFVELRVR